MFLYCQGILNFREIIKESYDDLLDMGQSEVKDIQSAPVCSSLSYDRSSQNDSFVTLQEG